MLVEHIVWHEMVDTITACFVPYEGVKRIEFDPADLASSHAKSQVCPSSGGRN